MNKIVILAALLFLSLSAFASNKSVYMNDKGVAIDGYDTVSYFVNKKAEQGKKEYSYCWHCALWYFANQQDLDKFKKDPQKYVPQYGGWCAFGIASGYFIKVDPSVWSIFKGKLYLNVTNKIRIRWLNKSEQYIAQANAQWQIVSTNGKIEKCDNLTACSM